MKVCNVYISLGISPMELFPEDCIEPSGFVEGGIFLTTARRHLIIQIFGM